MTRNDGYKGDAIESLVLGLAIGMAYLPAERTAPGTEFEIDIRGRRAKAEVVPMPFYKRAK